VALADILATRGLKVERELTYYAVTLPVGGPPYNGDTGYPAYGVGSDITAYLGEWSMTAGNRFAAGELVLALSPSATITPGDVVRVRERYSSATETGDWLTHGHWTIAGCEEGSFGPLNATAYESPYLLTTDLFIGEIKGDLIEVEKRALTQTVNPNTDGGEVYVYVDLTSTTTLSGNEATGQTVLSVTDESVFTAGDIAYIWNAARTVHQNLGEVVSVDAVAHTVTITTALTADHLEDDEIGCNAAHTINWANSPSAAQLWADETSFYPGENSCQVVYGDGEVHIERTYFEGDELDTPDTIYCAYWRYVVAGDTSVETITAADATTITCGGASWDANEFANQKCIIQDGDGKGKVFTVKSNTATVLTIANDDPTDWGLAADDTVQLRDANQAEDRLRQLLHDAGFQSKSDALPYWIEEIDCGDNNIYLTPAEYTTETAKQHLAVVREILDAVKPNVEIWADSAGHLHIAEVVQAESATYELTTWEGCTEVHDPGGIATEVIYRGRAPRVINRAWRASGGSVIDPCPYNYEWGAVAWPSNGATLQLKKNKTTVDTVDSAPSTTLDAGEDAAQTVLSVTATGNFAVGDRVRIWNAAGDTYQNLGKITEIAAGDTVTVTTGLTDAHLTDDLLENVEAEYLAYEAAIDNDMHRWFRWELDADLDKEDDPFADVDLFTIDLGAAYSLDMVQVMCGKNPDDTRGLRIGILASADNATWEWLSNDLNFKEYWESQRITEIVGVTARYVKVRCMQSAAKSDHREVSIGEVFVFVSDVIEMTAQAGVDRSGDTPAGADFTGAYYTALKQKLGRRRVIKPDFGVDENARHATDPDAYVQDRADEWLAALARDYSTLRVTGIRPDAVLNDTVQVTIASRSIDALYLVRTLDKGPGGTIRAELVSYA